MPRSRNIKPGFFQNEDLVELDFGTRLLFIGLWTIADREGRLENRPKKIKMQLFPADELDIPGALTMLAQKKMVTLYVVDNVEYIQIDNFLKHQHPHKKEQESVIPAPTSTGHAPDMHHACPADSLNPITDSLNLVSAKNIVEQKPDGVSEVFEFWQETFNHKKAVLDDKRKRFIKKALKLYSIDDCKAAITGCSNTPHNMGENDRKQKYNGIHIIFKDADQIERFIGNAEIKRKSFGAGAL